MRYAGPAASAAPFDGPFSANHILTGAYPMDRRPSRRTFLKTSSAAVIAGTLASPLGFPSLLRGAAASGKLKLGLISAATYGYMGAPRTAGSNHGTAFATACNGYDEAKRKQFEGTFVAAKKRIEGAQVVKIWDPVKAAAERLADVCGIPTVCDSADECCRGRGRGGHPGRRLRRAVEIRADAAAQGRADVLRQAAGHDRQAGQGSRRCRAQDRHAVHVGQRAAVRARRPRAGQGSAVAGQDSSGHDHLRQRAGVLRHSRVGDGLRGPGPRRGVVPERRPAGPQHRPRALRRTAAT